MPNTYSQVYHHYVFVVKYRERLIDESMRDELEKYITGIVTRCGQKLLAIYCMPDHVHVLVGVSPTCSDSRLMYEVKTNASKFINERFPMGKKFKWQDGFGVFSHCRSSLDTVVKYILNQKEHHRKENFREEYIRMLKEADIDFKMEYVFEFFD
jgi:putative transposase